MNWLLEEGLVQKPPHFQFVIGPMTGWMAPSVKHFMLIYHEAVALLGQGNHAYSVAGAEAADPPCRYRISLKSPSI